MILTLKPLSFVRRKKIGYLKEYDWQKKNYGIFIVDFADQELAHKIYFDN